LLTEGESPDDIKILLCAYTGKAAYNIDGTTIASAFHKEMYQPQQHMHADKLNTSRTKYRNLSAIIIDEISMVGNTIHVLTLINERLRELTCTKRDFGGVSIIAVGDLYQLPPIGEPWIFNDLSKPGQGFATNLWKKHFKIYELTNLLSSLPDDQNKTGQLVKKLTIAVDMTYDITVNVDITDGLTNGSICNVKYIEFRKESQTRPAIIWVMDW